MTAFPEVNRYPEIGGTPLRTKLSERFKVKLENVAIGSGSICHVSTYSLLLFRPTCGVMKVIFMLHL